MALVITDEQNFTDIAGAIRTKLSVETTYLPSEMAAAIESISGGSTLGTKSITANGTYAATDDSLDGYSEVTVNVSGISGVYKGTTAPSASLGSDGDVYIQNAELPSGIDFVEYIESDGNCYYDTGFVGDGSMTAYAKWLVATGNSWIMGARKSGSEDNLALFVADSSYLRYCYGAGATDESKTVPLNSSHETELGAIGYLNGTRVYTTSEASFETPVNMYIFALNNNGSVAAATSGSRIYRLTIRKNGTVYADFVPCLHDGAACFYEAVSGTYLTNQGTGTPTYGSAITPTESFAMYVKQDGSWVSKGVYPNFV